MKKKYPSAQLWIIRNVFYDPWWNKAREGSSPWKWHSKNPGLVFTSHYCITISYIPCNHCWSNPRPPSCVSPSWHTGRRLQLGATLKQGMWWFYHPISLQQMFCGNVHPWVCMSRAAHWPGLPLFDCNSDFTAFFQGVTQDHVSPSCLEQGVEGSCVSPSGLEQGDTTLSIFALSQWTVSFWTICD